MSNDSELLRRYVEEHAEGPFTELVHEHLNLVYSAALREMNGDRALAEDVSQAVFTELARKAPRLLAHPSLAGWLYTTVRHLSANLRRADQHRRCREEEVMNATLSEDSPNEVWQQLRPVLDDALHELKDADREAVVLRFLEERPLREVGARLGLTENAARMRVDRALDKLRALLALRGITSTASGLTAALAVGVLTPAPEALAATIAGTALAGGAAAVSTTVTLMKVMSVTKMSLLGVLVAGAVAVPVWQQTRLQHMQTQNAQLLAQQTHAQEAELSALREEVGRLRQGTGGQAELERLRQYQAQTQPELLRLRGMAGVARRANAEAEQLRAELGRPASQPGSNFIAGAMADAMKQALDQQVEARLSRMTASLHLTPEQIQAARDILTRQGQVMKQVFSGNFNQQDIARLSREAGNPEQQIQALLTPDQKAAYQNYQQEEAAYNARQAANTELLSMASTLDLSPEQKDRAFAALYDLSLNQLSGRATPGSTNQAEAMQWFLDQKAKALEPVLTAAQMESYRQQQTVQVKIAKDVLNRMQDASSPR
jgi:RNA polymerase sigma factor (sigma-70 family)